MLQADMVEGVDARFASLANHGRLFEVGRYSESAPGSALAVGAVADSVERGKGTDSDRCLSAGASCSHGVVLVGFVDDVSVARPNV